MVAIVGASGVGKSTLLHVLGGLDRVDAGSDCRQRHSIFRHAEPMATQVAFRNQQRRLRVSVSSPPAGIHRDRERRDADAHRAGCEPPRRARAPRSCCGGWVSASDSTHRPGMLSGGEQQRVAVARALVMRPALLLADEPTGDLDEQTADSLHALLREMHQAYGLTSVIATHNPRLAAACDRILRLEGGRLIPAPSAPIHRSGKPERYRRV